MEDESDQTLLKGWRSRWANRKFGGGAVGPFHDSDLGSFDAGYSPSIDPGAATIDVGSVSSHMDDSIALAHAFIDRQKPFLSKMPWENSIMEPIFGDPSSVQSLGMPSSWSVDISQPVPATEQL